MDNKLLNENLIKLYNNLYEINTKGKDTIIMGNCLQFLEKLINDINTTIETIQIPLDNLDIKEE